MLGRDCKDQNGTAQRKGQFTSDAEEEPDFYALAIRRPLPPVENEDLCLPTGFDELKKAGYRLKVDVGSSNTSAPHIPDERIVEAKRVDPLMKHPYLPDPNAERSESEAFYPQPSLPPPRSRPGYGHEYTGPQPPPPAAVPYSQPPPPLRQPHYPPPSHRHNTIPRPPHAEPPNAAHVLPQRGVGPAEHLDPVELAYQQGIAKGIAMRENQEREAPQRLVEGQLPHEQPSAMPIPVRYSSPREHPRDIPRDHVLEQQHPRPQSSGVAMRLYNGPPHLGPSRYHAHRPPAQLAGAHSEVAHQNHQPYPLTQASNGGDGVYIPRHLRHARPHSYGSKPAEYVNPSLRAQLPQSNHASHGFAHPPPATTAHPGAPPSHGPPANVNQIPGPSSSSVIPSALRYVGNGEHPSHQQSNSLPHGNVVDEVTSTEGGTATAITYEEESVHSSQLPNPNRGAQYVYRGRY